MTLKEFIILVRLLLQYALVATSDAGTRSVALNLARRVILDACNLDAFPNEPDDISDIPF